jgi:hypothetical protein
MPRLDGPGLAGALRRHENQPAWLRGLLVAEVVMFCGVMSLYLFSMVVSDGIAWYDVVMWVVAFLWPIGLNLLHGDLPADSGIRLDNIAEASLRAGVVTVLMAAGVLVTGLLVGSLQWPGAGEVLERVAPYLGWGLLQQYWLQAFALRRFRQAGIPVVWAVVAASGVFALVHAPNWMLVGLTFGSGLVWCGVFLRTPSLLPLAVSHAVLAVLTYYSLPEVWHQRLTVGGIYIRQVAK